MKLEVSDADAHSVRVEAGDVLLGQPAPVYGVLDLNSTRDPEGFRLWQVDAVETLAVSSTQSLEGAP